jgi:hypothetical protein
MTRSWPIGGRPAADPNAEQWVRGQKPTRAECYSARLTVDVTRALRGRIKVSAYQRGVTVAELLRELLEREFPASEPTP